MWILLPLISYHTSHAVCVENAPLLQGLLDMAIINRDNLIIIYFYSAIHCICVNKAPSAYIWKKDSYLKSVKNKKQKTGVWKMWQNSNCRYVADMLSHLSPTSVNITCLFKDISFSRLPWERWVDTIQSVWAVIDLKGTLSPTSLSKQVTKPGPQ